MKIKNDSHFKIIKNENIIKCEELIKTFQFNYDKRRILPYKKYNDGYIVMDAVPWGFTSKFNNIPQGKTK